MNENKYYIIKSGVHEMKDCDNPYEIEIFGIKCKKQKASPYMDSWLGKAEGCTLRVEKLSHPHQKNKACFTIFMIISGSENSITFSSYDHTFVGAKKKLVEVFKNSFEAMRSFSGRVI